MQGKASADHTTLLLNCYTKLKDVDKLDNFLRGSGAADSAPSLNFDVETAVKVTWPHIRRRRFVFPQVFWQQQQQLKT